MSRDGSTKTPPEVRPRSSRGRTTTACICSAGARLAFAILAGCGGSPFTLPSDLPSWPPDASPSPAISVSPQEGSIVHFGARNAVEAETDGWEFRPYTDIEVTALGYFDGSGDGLRHDHEVAIFDADSQDAIATAQVHPYSALQGAFRWESIRPVLLLTGKSYVVAGSAFPPYDPEAATEGTWAPELMRGDYREVHRDWSFPHEHFRRPCIGPNFKFKPPWTMLATP
jgi:hypothetical protein